MLLPAVARAATFGFPDSLNTADRLPGVKLTPYDDITGYNNFYEWGLDKGDPKVNANQGWKTEPWTIEIGGLCAKPGKYDVNDLVKAVGGIEHRHDRGGPRAGAHRRLRCLWPAETRRDGRERAG